MIEIVNLRTRKPNGANHVRVDRTSVLGNPFFLNDENERTLVCNKYGRAFDDRRAMYPEIQIELDRLYALLREHGALVLFCWCTPKQCHAETIKYYLEERMRSDNDGT